MGSQGNIVARIFSNKHFNFIAFGLIAGMIVIAYSNTFNASFHFDDDAAISENHLIKQATAESIFNVITSARPVVYLSVMLNYQLGGLNPVGWHIFNISVHIITSFFVYLFILWTLSTPSLRARYADHAKSMALFGALLFGVHPIQTESVTYIISRSELLATLFYMGTFLLFIKGVRKKSTFWMIAAAFSSVLSVGSKEWAVTLPAILFLYDFLFLSEGKLKPAVSRWMFYIVIIVLQWGTIWHTLHLTDSGGGSGSVSGSASVGFNVQTITGITPIAYLYTSLNVIWTYIRLLFLPIGQNLDYDYPIAKTLFEMPTILSLAGHLAVVAGAFWLYRAKKNILIPFGIAWFYIGLSPVQSFVPIIDVIFEHRLYMPSVGFFLVFITVYQLIFARFEGKRAESAVPSRR